MSSYLFKLAAPVILLSLAATANLKADSFSTIYAFGDSLSDAGNLYTATGGTIPGAPYVDGHFTNGPVWVQDLSLSLGLGNLTASLQGGHDYAYGDAFSGTSPVHTATALTAPLDLTGAVGQIAQFSAAHPAADPNALYTIWIGSNDLLAILQSNPSQAQAAADIGAVVGNVDSAISSLAGEGAKNFLIVAVPDLGKTPGVTAEGPLAEAGASALAANFDTALSGSLASASGLNISLLNTYALLDGVIANGAPYGFSNVTSPCVTGAVEYVGGTACSPTMAGQDQYLFWDDLHPTAAGHALVGEAALAVLTPEPATFALLGAGLFGFYLRRRKA